MKLLRALSIILLIGVISWQAYSGMYDWKAVTTSDLRRDWKSWMGRDVLLSNVSIRKYEIREQRADTLIAVWLVNGRTNPSKEEEAIGVVGRMPTEQARRFESLPWFLENGTKRLPRARVTVYSDIIVLKDYWLPTDGSWFDTPYWFAVNISNRFVSLRASVFTGTGVQALVYLVITLFVVEGLIYVLPDPG